MRFLVCFFVLLFTAYDAVGKAELICPCSFTSHDSTAANVVAGIRNLGDETTGDLRVRAWGYEGGREGKARLLSTAYYQERLKKGFVYPEGTARRTGFLAPNKTATFEVFFFLSENINGEWTYQDEVRLEPQKTLDTFGGAASGSGDLRGLVFFNGKPRAVVNGDQVTISLPQISNKSRTVSTGILELKLNQIASPEYFFQPGYVAATANLGFSIGPGQHSNETQITVPFVNRSAEDYDYFHLALLDPSQEFSTLVWQTVLTRGGIPIATRQFEFTSVDMLADSDLDGISDFNEEIMGTDQNDPNSFPGDSVLDVMVLYTASVAELYQEEPEARIIHELVLSNQVLSNSGIKASLRLVHLERVNYNDLVSNSVAIDAMQEQAGLFKNLDLKRQNAGADFVILYRPIIPGSGTCGIGLMTGNRDQGDFKTIHRKNVVAVVNIDCRDKTTIHELGHNSGLGHSRRDEDSNQGTFTWSRGHGVDAGFCTIMADFRYFPSCEDVSVFSNPSLTCLGGFPCGIEKEDREFGADAVLSWNTVRFQLAQLAPDPPDTDLDGVINFEDEDDDGDGVVDSQDAFPLDSGESSDTDKDGVGDNADIPIKLTPATTIELPVIGREVSLPDGSTSMVPAGATAVALNVTVVNPSGNGYVTVWPCGVERPLASNVNFAAGDIVPNGVLAPIGSNGKVCFFSFSQTDLVVDIAGWFTGDAFVSATPQRLVDSRKGTGSPKTKLVSSSPLTIKLSALAATTVDGTVTTVPSNISAVALNVTVVNPEGGGYVTVYPCDVERPLASNVNYVGNQVVANGVIAPVSGNGEVCLYSLATTDIVVDLAGWFVGNSFTGSVPNRLVDTRNGTGGREGQLTPADELKVPIRGVILSVNGSEQQVPTTAVAATLNVTVVNPSGNGYITAWPCGVERPLASNLNFVQGIVVANNVIAPIGDDGSICVYASAPTDVVVDISGWFTGDSENGFVGSTPMRLIDTRTAFGPPPL
ncbi:MAG TPA: hypothetical protein EYQ14_02815 [Gammaproteobacteria bacterium]|nr:hypothetical protein [Gammaproteobacteria bacterium]HIL94872.1 hypothetical protein [Pseudomonadales bacterium]